MKLCIYRDSGKETIEVEKVIVLNSQGHPLAAFCSLSDNHIVGGTAQDEDFNQLLGVLDQPKQQLIRISVQDQKGGE